MATVVGWQSWSERLWNILEKNFPDISVAMMHLEQKMVRSRNERCCVECGEEGTVKHHSVIMPSVSHYYMCDDCDHYWANKDNDGIED